MGVNDVVKRIVLRSREITIDDLDSLASYALWWPANLPAGFQLGRVMEMSESPDETSNSGIFILEFVNAQGDFVHLQQSGRPTKPSYRGKRPVAVLVLPYGKATVYQAEGLNFVTIFPESHAIDVIFRGVEVSDVEFMLSSLRPRS